MCLFLLKSVYSQFVFFSLIFSLAFIGFLKGKTVEKDSFATHSFFFDRIRCLAPVSFLKNQDKEFTQFFLDLNRQEEEDTIDMFLKKNDTFINENIDKLMKKILYDLLILKNQKNSDLSLIERKKRHFHALITSIDVRLFADKITSVDSSFHQLWKQFENPEQVFFELIERADILTSYKCLSALFPNGLRGDEGSLFISGLFLEYFDNLKDKFLLFPKIKWFFKDQIKIDPNQRISFIEKNTSSLFNRGDQEDDKLDVGVYIDLFDMRNTFRTDPDYRKSVCEFVLEKYQIAKSNSWVTSFKIRLFFKALKNVFENDPAFLSSLQEEFRIYKTSLGQTLTSFFKEHQDKEIWKVTNDMDWHLLEEDLKVFAVYFKELYKDEDMKKALDRVCRNDFFKRDSQYREKLLSEILSIGNGDVTMFAKVLSRLCKEEDIEHWDVELSLFIAKVLKQAYPSTRLILPLFLPLLNKMDLNDSQTDDIFKIIFQNEECIPEKQDRETFREMLNSCLTNERNSREKIQNFIHNNSDYINKNKFYLIFPLLLEDYIYSGYYLREIVKSFSEKDKESVKNKTEDFFLHLLTEINMEGRKIFLSEYLKMLDIAKFSLILANDKQRAEMESLILLSCELDRNADEEDILQYTQHCLNHFNRMDKEEDKQKNMGDFFLKTLERMSKQQRKTPLLYVDLLDIFIKNDFHLDKYEKKDEILSIYAFFSKSISDQSMHILDYFKRLLPSLQDIFQLKGQQPLKDFFIKVFDINPSVFDKNKKDYTDLFKCFCENGFRLDHDEEGDKILSIYSLMFGQITFFDRNAPLLESFKEWFVAIKEKIAKDKYQQIMGDCFRHVFDKNLYELDDQFYLNLFDFFYKNGFRVDDYQKEELVLSSYVSLLRNLSDVDQEDVLFRSLETCLVSAKKRMSKKDYQHFINKFFTDIFKGHDRYRKKTDRQKFLTLFKILYKNGFRLEHYEEEVFRLYSYVLLLRNLSDVDEDKVLLESLDTWLSSEEERLSQKGYQDIMSRFFMEACLDNINEKSLKWDYKERSLSLFEWFFENDFRLNQFRWDRKKDIDKILSLCFDLWQKGIGIPKSLTDILPKNVNLNTECFDGEELGDKLLKKVNVYPLDEGSFPPEYHDFIKTMLFSRLDSLQYLSVEVKKKKMTNLFLTLVRSIKRGNGSKSYRMDLLMECLDRLSDFSLIETLLEKSDLIPKYHKDGLDPIYFKEENNSKQTLEAKDFILEILRHIHGKNEKSFDEIIRAIPDQFVHNYSHNIPVFLAHYQEQFSGSDRLDILLWILELVEKLSPEKRDIVLQKLISRESKNTLNVFDKIIVNYCQKRKIRGEFKSTVINTLFEVFEEEASLFSEVSMKRWLFFFSNQDVVISSKTLLSILTLEKGEDSSESLLPVLELFLKKGVTEPFNKDVSHQIMTLLSDFFKQCNATEEQISNIYLLLIKNGLDQNSLDKSPQGDRVLSVLGDQTVPNQPFDLLIPKYHKDGVEPASVKEENTSTQALEAKDFVLEILNHIDGNNEKSFGEIIRAIPDQFVLNHSYNIPVFLAHYQEQFAGSDRLDILLWILELVEQLSPKKQKIVLQKLIFREPKNIFNAFDKIIVNYCQKRKIRGEFKTTVINTLFEVFEEQESLFSEGLLERWFFFFSNQDVLISSKTLLSILTLEKGEDSSESLVPVLELFLKKGVTEPFDEVVSHQIMTLLSDFFKQWNATEEQIFTIYLLLIKNGLDQNSLIQKAIPVVNQDIPWEKRRISDFIQYFFDKSPQWDRVWSIFGDQTAQNQSFDLSLRSA